MRKLSLKKIIECALISCSLFLLNPVSASAQWRQDSAGWWNTEGDSYSVGWRKIDGTWYYFYESNNYNEQGYMGHDTIIDGYYLNSSGRIEEPNDAVKAYINVLKDNAWQKNNKIIMDENGKSTISRNIVLDIDNDGVYDMIVQHGVCSADSTVSVLTYKNGKVNIQHIDCAGTVTLYSPISKVFLVEGGHMDHYFINGYTLQNNNIKQVFCVTASAEYGEDSNGYMVEKNRIYTIDNNIASESEVFDFFKKYSVLPYQIK